MQKFCDQPVKIVKKMAGKTRQWSALSTSDVFKGWERLSRDIKPNQISLNVIVSFLTTFEPPGFFALEREIMLGASRTRSPGRYLGGGYLPGVAYPT